MTSADTSTEPRDRRTSWKSYNKIDLNVFYNGQPAMDEKVLSEVRSSRSIYTFGYNGKKRKKKGKAANKVERIYFISYIIMYFVEKKTCVQDDDQRYEIREIFSEKQTTNETELPMPSKK